MQLGIDYKKPLKFVDAMDAKCPSHVSCLGTMCNMCFETILSQASNWA